MDNQNKNSQPGSTTPSPTATASLHQTESLPEATPTPAPETVSIPPAPKKNRKGLIIGLAILPLIIAGATVYWLLVKADRNTIEQPSDNQQLEVITQVNYDDEQTVSKEMQNLREVDKKLAFPDSSINFRIEEDKGVTRDEIESRYVAERYIALRVFGPELITKARSSLDNDSAWVAYDEGTSYYNMDKLVCISGFKNNSTDDDVTLTVASASHEDCVKRMPVFNLQLMSYMLAPDKVNVSQGNYVGWYTGNEEGDIGIPPSQTIEISGANGKIHSQEITAENRTFKYMFTQKGTYTWVSNKSSDKGTIIVE